MADSEDVAAFLKKYTPVSGAFIDDFLSMYTVRSRPTDFVVDLDIAARWLSARKETLKSTLVSSYTRGIDYDVIRPEATELMRRGKGRLQRVMMTADCFKTLCMQSRTKKAAEVRAYFLAVEAALFRYREEIAEGMARRIGVLERNQGPKPSAEKGEGVIYVVRAADHSDSVYKIGRTTNLAQRLRSHGSSLADSLDVVYVFKTRCVEKVEGCMKVMLKEKQYRKYKEVYQIDLELLKKVITGCDDVCIQTVYHNRAPLSKTKAEGGGLQHTGGYYAVVVPL